MIIDKYQKINLKDYCSYTSYDIEYIKDGIIYVKKDEKHSFISTKSKNIFNHDKQLNWYKDIDPFYNGQSIVCFDDTKYGVIDEESNLLNGTYYNEVKRINEKYYRIREKDNYGIIDRNGKLIINMNEYEPLYQKDGNFILHKSFKGCKLFNMKKGKITAQYLKIEHLNNNLYKAITETIFASKYQSKMGVIDENNNIVIPFKYQKIIYVNDKVLLVDNGKKYKYIDYNNKELKEISKNIEKDKYQYIHNYKYGYAIAKKDYNSFYLIDDKAKQVSGSYHSASFIKDNILLVSLFFGYKLVNFLGQNITQKIYKRIEDFYHGVAIVMENKNIISFGLINEAGEELIADCKNTEFISECIARITVDEKQYLINFEDKKTIKKIYQLMGKNTQVNEKDGLIVIDDIDNNDNVITRVINSDGQEIVGPIRNQRIVIFNKDTLCVEGCLVDINDFKYSYCVDIKNDLKNTTKEFDSDYKMDLFIEYISVFLNQKIDTFYDMANGYSLSSSFTENKKEETSKNIQKLLK